MNVALFASAFYPHVGGVEEHVRQLAHECQRRNLTPIVLTNRWPRSLPAYEEYEGIPIYRLAMRVPEGGLKARLNYRLTHAGIVREMLAVLKKHNTSLLHVHCVSSNGFYASIAKKTLSLPLVVTTHGERTMDAAQIYQRSPFMNQTLCALLAEADYITACSQHTLDDMQDYYGQPFGCPAGVVYNGIRLADFAEGKPYAHPKPYILGIGRHVTQKGFDVLLRAFSQVSPASHDLLLAGDGPERDVLEELARTLGVSDRVHFLGRADHTTAVSLFLGCSFFVLPSRQEPQGIVNLEAMAAGKAVVASHVGGVPEIVLDGKTGLLVPGEEPNALSEAMTRLVMDEKLRHQLGQAGRQCALNFDWQAIADQYATIYDTVTRTQQPS